MSWTDEEIDKLFNESANAQSFKYDNAYFSEIEAALPINKKGKDFLWMGTALLFIAVLTTGYFVNNTNDNAFNGTNDQLANLELNNGNTGNTVANSATSNGQTSSSLLTKKQLTNQANTASEEETLNLAGLANLAASSNLKKSSAPSNDKVLFSGLNPNQFNSITSEPSVDPAFNLLWNPSYSLLDPEFNSNYAAITGLVEISSEDDIASLELESIKEIDQNLDRSLMPNALPFISQLRPKAVFYVELNGGVSQSLITPSAYTSTSYGGGFGVETYLGNFNLSTGLNFKLSDHNDLSLTRSGKFYGFGSVLAKNTYDYEKVYSIELPINLGYNFGNHNVNLGIRPSVLVGAKIKHESFQDGELTRSKESYGLAGGLKRYGVKPTIGYSYHVNKWTVGANIGVQLLQSVNEDWINGINNRFPVDGQIYLRRTIRLRK